MFATATSWIKERFWASPYVDSNRPHLTFPPPPRVGNAEQFKTVLKAFGAVSLWAVIAGLWATALYVVDFQQSIPGWIIVAAAVVITIIFGSLSIFFAMCLVLVMAYQYNATRHWRRVCGQIAELHTLTDSVREKTREFLAHVDTALQPHDRTG